MTNKTEGSKGTKISNTQFGNLPLNKLEKFFESSFGSFYGTPVEPVDPMDCAAWPSSPYCGGNPFNNKFVDLGVEIAINECGACITIQPTLAYLQMPAATYCYVLPACKPKPKPLPHDPIPLPCSPTTQVSWEELENSNTTTGIAPRCPPPSPPNESFGKPGEIIILEHWCKEERFNKTKSKTGNGSEDFTEDEYNGSEFMRFSKRVPAPYTPQLTSNFQDNSYIVDQNSNPNMIYYRKFNSYYSLTVDNKIGYLWSEANNNATRSYSYMFANVDTSAYLFREIEMESAGRGSRNCSTIVKNDKGETLWPKSPEEPLPMPSPQTPKTCCCCCC